MGSSHIIFSWPDFEIGLNVWGMKLKIILALWSGALTPTNLFLVCGMREVLQIVLKLKKTSV